MTTFSDGSVAYVATPDLVSNNLVVLRDANMDGQITLDELVTVWTTADGDFPCDFIDVRGVADGTAVALSQGGLAIRMSDGNGDGTFLDDGETYVIYDPTFTNANGTPNPMTFIAAALE